jgi:hypothetical protein
MQALSNAAAHATPSVIAGANVTFSWQITNTGNVKLHSATFSTPGIQAVSCGGGSSTAASPAVALEVDGVTTCT